MIDFETYKARTDAAIAAKTYRVATLRRAGKFLSQTTSFCDQETLDYATKFSRRSRFDTAELLAERGGKLVVIKTLSRSEFLRANAFAAF